MPFALICYTLNTGKYFTNSSRLLEHILHCYFSLKVFDQYDQYIGFGCFLNVQIFMEER